MRVAVFVGCVISVLTGMSGCSDLQCQPGERKVGSTCVDWGQGDAGEQASADGGGIEPRVTPEGERGVGDGETGKLMDAGGAARMPEVGAEPDAGGVAATGKIYGCPAPRQCAEWPMPGPGGKARPSYVNDEETVTDQVTQLVWQRHQPALRPTHLQATQYCESLVLGGKDDWRLPSLIEVRSLYDFGRDPTNVVAAVQLEEKPLPVPYWWTTSFRDESGIDRVYQVALSDLFAMRGNLNSDKVHVAEVRCVRGGIVAQGSRYTTDDGTNTVTDNWTKLVWQRREDPNPLSKEEAVSRCSKLGYYWRVPTIKELWTLIDVTRIEPTIDIEAFPATAPEPYWASEIDLTPTPERPYAHAIVEFGPSPIGAGRLTYASPSSGGEVGERFRVRCVR